MEPTVLLSGRNNGFNRASADILDRGQAETYTIRNHREVFLALIDVGRQHADPKLTAFRKVPHHLVGIAHLTRQQSGHKLGRIVRLEIRRVVRHQRVGRGMGLVEAIAGKVGHQIKQFLGLLFGQMVLPRATDEQRLLFLHFLGLLFSHRPTQQIGLPQRKPGQPISDGHHLLLIDDNPIGVPQYRFQGRRIIGQVRWAAFPFDEIIHHPAFERPRTVQGQHGDQILKPFGCDLDQKIAHPRTFQLENSGRARGRQQRVGRGVIQGKAGHIERGTFQTVRGGRSPFVHETDRMMEHGQCLESEEVELDEPDFLHISH